MTTKPLKKRLRNYHNECTLLKCSFVIDEPSQRAKIIAYLSFRTDVRNLVISRRDKEINGSVEIYCG